MAKLGEKGRPSSPASPWMVPSHCCSKPPGTAIGEHHPRMVLILLRQRGQCSADPLLPQERILSFYYQRRRTGKAFFALDVFAPDLSLKHAVLVHDVVRIVSSSFTAWLFSCARYNTWKPLFFWEKEIQVNSLINHKRRISAWSSL